MLEDGLADRDISQSEFAVIIGMNRLQLNEYIKGKPDFSTELCLVVAEALEMDKEIWLNFKSQSEIDKAKSNIDLKHKLKKSSARKR